MTRISAGFSHLDGNWIFAVGIYLDYYSSISFYIEEIFNRRDEEKSKPRMAQMDTNGK